MKNNMEIGGTVYNLDNVMFFMNPYHYKKANLNMITKQIIAVNDAGTKYAIDTFNGRYENWFDPESGKSTGWSTATLSLDPFLLYSKYEEVYNNAVEKQLKADVERIKVLENEIANIKSKNTHEWKFIHKQQQNLEKLKEELLHD